VCVWTRTRQQQNILHTNFTSPHRHNPIHAHTNNSPSIACKRISPTTNMHIAYIITNNLYAQNIYNHQSTYMHTTYITTDNIYAYNIYNHQSHYSWRKFKVKESNEYFQLSSYSRIHNLNNWDQWTKIKPTNQFPPLSEYTSHICM